MDQRGSFPQDAVPQEQAVPAWVPHRVTSPASKPAPAWAPLSMGLQVLAGACSSAGSPQGHSFLQASTCSSVGSLPRAVSGYLLHCGTPWAAVAQPASPWPSPRAAREGSLLRHLEHLLPPPSSLTLVSAELFLSHRLTPLFRLPFHHISFLPLLKYIITEALPPSLIGLGLGSGGSILEPASTDFVRHGGNFLQLLTEATPIAPLLQKLSSLKEAATPWGARTGAGLLAGLVTPRGTNTGAVCEGLHPVGRTHIGEIHGELSPVRGTSRWSRG